MRVFRTFLPLLAIACFALTTLTSCALPRVSAEDRLFLNLSVDFLDEYTLPSTLEVDGTPVRGLSALTYDRQGDRFLVLSDDRGDQAPARFYTLNLTLTAPQLETGAIAIQDITINEAITLLDEAGNPYLAGTVDPEGIALSPRQTVFIASEGVSSQGIAPFVAEFDLATGQWQRSLPIPDRYLPQVVDEQPSGVQDNRGFEALTLNPGGYSAAWLEPFRLFVATENALVQDLPVAPDPEAGAEAPIYTRLLHYLIGDERPTLISEHIYPVSPDPNAFETGLTELVVLDQGGHFLGLERSFGLTGFGDRLYQLATGGATDTSGIEGLRGNINGIEPIRKQLLLDLSDLGIRLDNLEGMTLGPRLPDGSQSLLLISDDNFREEQTTQVLLFRLTGLQ